MVSTDVNQKRHCPVLVDGVRTPFRRSHQGFVDLSSCDLGRYALRGLIDKTGIDPAEIQHVVMGTVIHDPRTSNVARESWLSAGLPVQTPANTVTLACISSNVAAMQLADMIRLGRLDAAIFGGTDTCSDPPIRVSRNLRKLLVRLSKTKGAAGWLKVVKHFRFKDLALDVPQVVEFSNGKSMGQGAELLALQAGVTREESDRFAERSHRLAVKALRDGVFAGDIVSVHVPPKSILISEDDGPREDAIFENLSKLKPAFDKQFGISTAGSSSFLTDGASAVLMMSWQAALDRGYTPKAIIKDYVYGAGSALNDMLSGPSLTIPHLLKRNGLKVQDVDVWEIHEAFAAQVVANLKLMKDKNFARDRLGLDEAIGEVPLEKVNIWGGSLSLGHPFGATGGRLLYTAAKRLAQSEARYAVVSGCAAGGHGSAILLENPNVYH